MIINGPINNKEALHIIADRYNWDNGFDVPNAISDRKECDLGTALLLFYNADGYRFLMDRTSVDESLDVEWKNFLYKLYNKIGEGMYNTKDIAYKPQISEVQIYKIKKVNPDILDVFLYGNEGENTEL